jgi:Uma2 family endonuclease
VAGKLYSRLEHRLEQWLSNKACRPFIAPVDVVLSEYDIVQPDVFVVCDRNKITDANIQGAPEVVIEVLSPATALKDLREKKNLYEKFGVKEYVIIDPLEEYAERFCLGADGTYTKGEVFGPLELLPFKLLEGIEVNLSEIFEVEKA